MAWPLTQLLKKNSFLWSEAAEQAFNALKSAMADMPRLAMPDFSLPFEIETDAMRARIGAGLIQQGRALAFISQALSEKAKTKSVYEWELMAIRLAEPNWWEVTL